MDNVNNLNGVSNFGHGVPQEVAEALIPTENVVNAIDEADLSTETKVEKTHKSKVKSAAQKVLGGKY